MTYSLVVRLLFRQIRPNALTLCPIEQGRTPAPGIPVSGLVVMSGNNDQQRSSHGEASEINALFETRPFTIALHRVSQLAE